MSDRKLTRNEAHQIRVKQLLADAAPRLIARMLELAASENESVALQATKALLDYQIAKPKDVQQVEHKVTNATAAQLSALAAMAKPLNSLPNQVSSGKLPINHAPVIEGEAVRVAPDSDADSA